MKVMPEEFVRVASTSSMPSGKLKGVSIGRDQIVLANVDGKYYAMGSICTHAQCDLSDGTLEGETLICSGHAAEWDLKSGYAKFAVPLPPEPLYDVKVDGSDILIRKRE